MAFQINGPNGGNGIIFGNTFPNDDIINAFDFNNLIFSEGANDQINTGLGFATVNLGSFVGVTDTVNVGGANNTVATSGSHLASTLTVQGGTGNNLVSLSNVLGNNNVAMQGYNNVITVNGNANNVVLSGAGRGTVHAGTMGDGNTGFHTTVDAAGQNNTVIGGDQDFFVSGGQGVDFISLGNGNNTIFEAGAKDKITVGTGSNTITDFGGFATITFNGFVEDINDIDIVNIGGTNNTVTETLAAAHSERDVTITGGTGNGKFTLGDGANVLTTSGSNNVVKMGSTEAPVAGEEIGEASGDAVTIIGGVNNSVTLGDGNNVVKVDGVASTITLGNGANNVTANGDDDVITVGNGSNTITANGKEDTITLGNGSNTLAANGNVDVITAGNGNNKITAQGNGDTITLGTGNNTLDATGSNNDTITSAGGKGSFIIGGETSLTLTASLAGTTVDAQGALDSIALNSNANVAINNSPFGGGLTLTINAAGGANAGVVKLTGFESDVTGLIDLHGFAAITNTAQLLAVSGSDGFGGTLIHLGTGSLDLVGSTINNASFSFA